MSQIKIVVVEDDPYIQDIVKLYLTKEGYVVAQVTNGDQALEVIASEKPDLVLLDVMLPKVTGWDLAPQVRQQAIPLIFLTARSDEMDKMTGFDLGADDYITKPFSPRELVARVKAVLRRSLKLSDTLEFAGLVIDLEKRNVEVCNQPIVLTPKEFDLLVFLCRHPRKVFSREQLVTQVWGYDFPGDDRTVDVHIKRLRKKIEVHPNYSYIQTVWGVGYRFEVAEAVQ